jgi:hypothetical protein
MGITMLLMPLQPENAEPPIEVTLLGILIVVRPLQPENANPPIEVTPEGIMYAPVFWLGNAINSVWSLLKSAPFGLE